MDDEREAIRKQVVALAIPAIGHSLLHVAVFFVDRMLLGRYSSEAIAAMQIAGPLNWAMHSLLTCYIVGSVATVARATGARDFDEVQLNTVVSLFLAIFVGLAALMVLPFLPRIMSLYESKELSQLALEGAFGYLSAVLPAYVFFCFGNTCGAIMAATGDTKTPFFVGLVTNTVNVLLNYVLIYGYFGFPELGVRGAGIATASAWACEALILACLLTGKGRILSSWSCFWSFPRVDYRSALRRISKISVPTLIERLVFHTGFLAFAGLITTLGTASMAANQAVISIESLSFTTSGACGVAAAAVVGQQLGAGRLEAASQGAWEAVKLALLFLMAASAVYVTAGALLLSLFTKDPEIIALGATILLICAFEQPGLGASDVLAQALRGAGDTRGPLLVTLCSVWLIRVFGTWLCVSVFFWGLEGVWWVTAVEWTVKALILAWIFRGGAWKKLDI